MRALVTGAASGIGLATTRHFLREGWQVIGLDRLDPPSDLTPADWILCDLAEPLAVSAACDRLADRSGDADSVLDALVICAGIAGVGDLARVLQINFVSARHLVRSLSPLVCDGGSVTIVSSGAGWRWMDRKEALLAIVREPDDGRALAWATALCGSAAEAYNCSKELLCALVAHDCLIHWPRGVRLNSVSPGSVNTPLIADFMASMGDDAMHFSRGVVGRDGNCDEIAEVISFLATCKASWINGADIKVDGGLTGALAGDVASFPGWVK